MSLDEFLDQAKCVPTQFRKGQYFYNLLAKVRPELAHMLMEVGVDPFYDDKRIPAAIQFLQANW